MKNQKTQSSIAQRLNCYYKLSFWNYICVLNFISVITVDGKNCKTTILVANGLRFIENTLLQFNHQKLSLEKKITYSHKLILTLMILIMTCISSITKFIFGNRKVFVISVPNNRVRGELKSSANWDERRGRGSFLSILIQMA